MGTGLGAFTLFHVALSLVGIFTGLVLLFALFSAKYSNGWTATFLVATTATSVTGFLFPFHKFLPSHAVGIVSLLVLAVTIPALYVFHLAGPWRRTYVIGAVCRPLSQRFCFNRPAFHEDSRAQGAGAYAIGAPVPRGAGGGHVGFHCTWDSRG
jgi:hypothetical protein